MWGTLIQERAPDESPLAIVLEGAHNEAEDIFTVYVTLEAEQVLLYEDLRLRLALTEDSIYYEAPNGTSWHNYTFRDMIPNAEGRSVTIEYGTPLSIEQQFDCPEPLDRLRCRLVVWVQADGSEREILQTSFINIPDFVPVDIDEISNLPTKFELKQNYPNPFNARTTIDFQLSVGGDVELAVYDVTGRQIITLADGGYQAGNYSLSWNGVDSKGHSVASGMYFYKLIAEGKISTKRMLLLK